MLRLQNRLRSCGSVSEMIKLSASAGSRSESSVNTCLLLRGLKGLTCHRLSENPRCMRPVEEEAVEKLSLCLRLTLCHRQVRINLEIPNGLEASSAGAEIHDNGGRSLLSFLCLHRHSPRRYTPSTPPTSLLVHASK